MQVEILEGVVDVKQSSLLLVNSDKPVGLLLGSVFLLQREYSTNISFAVI
jgi:hypothetical protein